MPRYGRRSDSGSFSKLLLDGENSDGDIDTNNIFLQRIVPAQQRAVADVPEPVYCKVFDPRCARCARRYQVPGMQGAGYYVLSVPRISFSAPPRAVLGVLQQATDLTMDVEGSLVIHQIPGVEVRYAKVIFEDEEICAETYTKAVESGAVGRAAASIGIPSNYITTWGLASTSMPFFVDPNAILDQVKPYATSPEVVVTDMWQCVLAALRALSPQHGTRLAVLVPYIPLVARKNLSLLKEAGFEIASSLSLGLAADRETSAVTQDCIAECVRKLACTNEPQMVLVGSSAFRACTPGFVSTLEGIAGMPVVTSAQAFLWHMLRVSGVDDTLEGYGILFSEH